MVMLSIVGISSHCAINSFFFNFSSLKLSAFATDLLNSSTQCKKISVVHKRYKLYI